MIKGLMWPEMNDARKVYRMGEAVRWGGTGQVEHPEKARSSYG